MHGRCFAIADTPVDTVFVVTFQHANYELDWWVLRINFDDAVSRALALQTAAHPGRLYNSSDYGLSQEKFTSWDGLTVDDGWVAAKFTVTGDPPYPLFQDGTF